MTPTRHQPHVHDVQGPPTTSALTANTCTWRRPAHASRPAPCRHRSARRRHRDQPAAPGGQGGRGHQHDGRRRDEPRRGREPGQARLRRPRRRRSSGSSQRSTPTTTPPTRVRTPQSSATAGRSSPTPRPEAQPTVQEQDAIRNAFIYNPRLVKTVGVSQILVNSPADAQRPRAAGPGLQAPRRHARRRLHRHHQPLQVQGRAGRPEHHRRDGTTRTSVTEPAPTTATGSVRPGRSTTSRSRSRRTRASPRCS